jgi:hypothetical protein
MEDIESKMSADDADFMPHLNAPEDSADIHQESNATPSVTSLRDLTPADIATTVGSSCKVIQATGLSDTSPVEINDNDGMIAGAVSPQQLHFTSYLQHTRSLDPCSLCCLKYF